MLSSEQKALAKSDISLHPPQLRVAAGSGQMARTLDRRFGTCPKCARSFVKRVKTHMLKGTESHEATRHLIVRS